MKKLLAVFVVVVVATAFTVFAGDKCCPAGAVEKAATDASYSADKATAKADCVACAGCKAAGTVCEKCAAKRHIISVKDGKAQCCDCKKDCKCTVKEGDTKCSCGKDVKTCDLKGKFVCDCPDGCKCMKISDKAGKCDCGKELKEVK
jgi:hypothetical protein